MQQHQRFGANWKTQNVSERVKQEVNNVRLEFNLFKNRFVPKLQCEFGLFVLRESSLFSQAEIDHLKKNIVSNINSYFLQSVGDKFKSHSCSSNAGIPIGCPHHSVDESKSNRMMRRMPML